MTFRATALLVLGLVVPLAVSETNPAPQVQQSQGADEGSADYKAYVDYKQDMEHAGKGAMNFKEFTQAYQKYQDFMQYVSKQGSRSPVSFEKFLDDYEKYMDFHKYMDQGQSRQADQTQNFKGFMDFEKYLSQSGQGGQVPASYQKFMDDYRKYMDYKQYAGNQGAPVDFQTFTANYQKFMDFQKYMAKQAGGSSLNPVSFAADSGSEASGGESAGDSAAPADDKSGNMGSNYMDYSHFVPAGTTQGGPKGGLAGATADFRKYMDYSKYMQISHQYTQKNWMNEWQKFQQQGGQQQQVPYSPTDCKTISELDAWKAKQTEIAKTWIPKDYQGPTLDNIEKDYKTNLERIKNPNAAADDEAVADAAAVPPAVALAAAGPGQMQGAEPEYLFSADKCQTKAQLNAWRQKQFSQLSKYVPKDYQKYSTAPIEAEYAKQLKRIESAAAPSAPAPAAQTAVSQLQRPDTARAKTAQTVEELIAWRADMSVVTEQLPAQERAQWNVMLSKELEASLARLRKAQRTEVEPLNAVAAVQPAPRSKATEFSRTVLVFVVSFCIPVAGVYVYRGIKQASLAGTDYDARFMALEGEA